MIDDDRNDGPDVALVSRYCQRTRPILFAQMLNKIRHDTNIPKEIMAEKKIRDKIMSYVVNYRPADVCVIVQKHSLPGKETGCFVRHGLYKVRGCKTLEDVAKRFMFWNDYDEHMVYHTTCPLLANVVYNYTKYEPVIVAPNKTNEPWNINYAQYLDDWLAIQRRNIFCDTGYGLAGRETTPLMLTFRERKVATYDVSTIDGTEMAGRESSPCRTIKRQKMLTAMERRWIKRKDILVHRDEMFIQERGSLDGIKYSLLLWDTPPIWFDEGYSSPPYSSDDDSDWEYEFDRK